MRRWRRLFAQRSGGRLAIGAGLLAAAAVVLWIARDENAPRAVASRGATEASPSPPASAPSAPPEPSAPIAAASEPAASADIEKVDVCGVGWTDAEADGSIDMVAIVATPLVVEARSRLLDSLRADAGGFGAATSVALELRRPGGPSGLPLVFVAHCKLPECNASEPERTLGRSMIDRLAKQAAATTDPRVYHLAFQLCGPMLREGDSACAMLSAAQWARLDAGNAEPWLQMLNEASARNDRAGVDDALYQIGGSARLEERRFAVAGLVVQHASSADADLLAAEQLAQDAMGVTALSPWSPAPLANACAPAAMRDANRREACEAAASTLAERSDSFMAMRIGAMIGRRLGWSDERLDAVDVLYEANSASWPIETKPLDPARLGASFRSPVECDSIRKVLAYIARQAAVGEPQAAREWLASRGDAEVYRKRVRANRERRSAQERAEEAGRAAARAARAAATVTPYSAVPQPTR